MNSNQADIEAGEWLARMDRGDLTPADLSAFERWRAADPRRDAAYARLAAAWQVLERIQAIRPPPAEPIDNDYLYRAMQHPPQKSRALSSPWFYLSAAASIVVAVVGFWIARTSAGLQTFRTGTGGFQRIALEDRSIIELNTDSEVRVALSTQMRKVELVRGEASFEVAHDASRPFIVSAGKTAVRAVGTKFDVRRLQNSIEVIVDEGKVVVGAPAILETFQSDAPPAMLRVSAGQAALSSGTAVKLTNLPQDSVARKLAWQNPMLVFDGDSLAAVVAQFNRYNERQLVILDPDLATLRIGGYFHPTHLDAFISVLQSEFGIRVNTEGNRLVLALAPAN